MNAINKQILGIVFMLLVLSMLTACGGDEEVTVEEVKELNKGQSEVQEINNNLAPTTDLDQLQDDVKDFDDW